MSRGKDAGLLSLRTAFILAAAAAIGVAVALLTFAEVHSIAGASLAGLGTFGTAALGLHALVGNSV